MSTILQDTVDRADAAPDFVEAEVRYVVDDGTPPYRYIDWPEMADQDRPPAYEPRRVKIANARTSGETFTLPTHGFTLVEHKTAMQDFYDEEEVLRVYYPETEALIKAQSGAQAGHRLRPHGTHRRQVEARRALGARDRARGPQRLYRALGAAAVCATSCPRTRRRRR